MRLSQKDPTDDALAAIASIRDNSDAPLVTAHPEAEAAEAAGDDAPPTAADHDGADVYSRSGPGPLDAIRFKWTARRDANGDYFVDETIGPQSRAMTSGPMPRGQAIAFVDQQEREARDRFTRLKDDMTVRSPEQAAAKAAVEQAHREHDASEDQGF